MFFIPIDKLYPIFKVNESQVRLIK